MDERGNDRLDGEAGTDLLLGRNGIDTLIGGLGTDRFVFDTSLLNNVDSIRDFDAGGDADRLLLNDTVFAALGEGPLLASQFHVGAAAGDRNDYIVYNSVTGALLYDEDGSGQIAAVQFAQLNESASATYADFMVI